jgi:sec-independent protein translocase protein TatA
MPNLGGWELIILLGVLVLVFGAKKLPDMARSIGQSARVFKGEMKGLKDDGAPAPAPAPTPTAVLPVVSTDTAPQPVQTPAPVDATR